MGRRFAWTRIELIRALADLSRERANRTRGTVAMYAVLGAFGVLVATVPVCGTVQDQLARAHHLRPSSAASWAVFQVVPKMYTFAHRVYVGYDADVDDMLPRLWMNHYPGRVVRMETLRRETVERHQDVHVLLRSGYRGRRWTSRFVVQARDGGLVISPEGDAP